MRGLGVLGNGKFIRLITLGRELALSANGGSVRLTLRSASTMSVRQQLSVGQTVLIV